MTAFVASHPAAPLSLAVRKLRRRPKWRHLLAGGAGVALMLVLVANALPDVEHRVLPSMRLVEFSAIAYVLAALLFAWGAAAGFTPRLALWIPLTLVLGIPAIVVVAIIVLAVSSIGGMDEQQTRDGTKWDTTVGRQLTFRVPNLRRADPGTVLAAQLVNPHDVTALLGPTYDGPQLPWTRIARSRSLAIWQAPVAPSAGRPPAAASRPSFSLIVHLSAHRARQLRRGRRPGGSSPLKGVGNQAYVQTRRLATAVSTRVVACSGDWVVTVAVRANDGAVPTSQLAGAAARALEMLSVC